MDKLKKCPNCDRVMGKQAEVMTCPHCDGMFCGHCFLSDQQDITGQTNKCPHCRGSVNLSALDRSKT